MPSPPRVELDGVAVSHGPVTLLRPVHGVVEPGSCLVVRGDNGSGKTTLLRVVAGVQESSAGQVLVDGEGVDPRDPSFRARLAGLLGPSAVYRDLTVYEHLLLVDASWGGDPGTVEERIDEMLHALTIAALADRFVSELSSGQRQLADLALVLFRPGDLLVLDEPEQRLDSERRGIVAELLRRRVEAGATALVATHDPVVAEALGDAELELVVAQE